MTKHKPPVMVSREVVGIDDHYQIESDGTTFLHWIKSEWFHRCISGLQIRKGTKKEFPCRIHVKRCDPGLDDLLVCREKASDEFRKDYPEFADWYVFFKYTDNPPVLPLSDRHFSKRRGFIETQSPESIHMLTSLHLEPGCDWVRVKPRTLEPVVEI